MSHFITQEHLKFLDEAKQVFENDIALTTYTNEDLDLIALRRGADRDCVQVLLINHEVAFFTEQLRSVPHMRKPLYEFSTRMEWQLRMNDHKPGWKCEHNQDLSAPLRDKVEELRQLFMTNWSERREEISELCADIGNYAMMLYDNEGEKL